MAVIPCAREAEDKVEQGVSLAEGWIQAVLRLRTFCSLAEVKEAVRPLLSKLTERPA